MSNYTKSENPGISAAAYIGLIYHHRYQNQHDKFYLTAKEYIEKFHCTPYIELGELYGQFATSLELSEQREIELLKFAIDKRLELNEPNSISENYDGPIHRLASLLLKHNQPVQATYYYEESNNQLYNNDMDFFTKNAARLRIQFADQFKADKSKNTSKRVTLLLKAEDLNKHINDEMFLWLVKLHENQLTLLTDSNLYTISTGKIFSKSELKQEYKYKGVFTFQDRTNFLTGKRTYPRMAKYKNQIILADSTSGIAVVHKNKPVEFLNEQNVLPLNKIDDIFLSGNKLYAILGHEPWSHINLENGLMELNLDTKAVKIITSVRKDDPTNPLNGYRIFAIGSPEGDPHLWIFASKKELTHRVFKLHKEKQEVSEFIFPVKNKNLFAHPHVGSSMTFIENDLYISNINTVLKIMSDGSKSEHLLSNGFREAGSEWGSRWNFQTAMRKLSTQIETNLLIAWNQSYKQENIQVFQEGKTNPIIIKREEFSDLGIPYFRIRDVVYYNGGLYVLTPKALFYVGLDL